MRTSFFSLIVISVALFYTNPANSLTLTETLNQDTPLTHTTPHTHYVIIPGICGHGGTHLFTEKVISCPQEHTTFVETPAKIEGLNLLDRSYADFGQKNCQAFMTQTIDPLFERADITKIVFHASSQGTASLIHYLANRSEQLKENAKFDKIGAIILESVMASGNGAIYQCVTQTFKFHAIEYGKWLRYTPFSHIWIPLVATSVFPHYDPFAQQPIDRIKSLPVDVPLIILHPKKDHVLPYQSAVSFIRELKNHRASQLGADQAQHTYFMPSDRAIHIDVLSSHIQETEHHDNYESIKQEATLFKQYFTSILNYHKLLPTDQLSNCVDILAPDHETFARFQDLNFRNVKAHLLSYQDQMIRSLRPFTKSLATFLKPQFLIPASLYCIATFHKRLK